MEHRWSVGSIVALVAFISFALLPWVYLFFALAWQELVGAGLIWLVIGTFAAANTAEWRKRDVQRGK